MKLQRQPMIFPPQEGTTCCRESEEDWGHKLIMDTWCEVWGHLCCWPPDPGHSEDPGDEVIRGPGVIGGPGGRLWCRTSSHLRRKCEWRRHRNYVDHNIHKYFDRTHCSHGEGGWLSLACCILHSSSTILLYASIIIFPSPLNRSAICLPFPDNLQQSKDEKLL